MSERQFCVVQSDDGRLSLWPQVRDIPWGWQATGFAGSKEECLAHIASAANQGVSAENGEFCA